MQPALFIYLSPRRAGTSALGPPTTGAVYTNFIFEPFPCEVLPEINVSIAPSIHTWYSATAAPEPTQFTIFGTFKCDQVTLCPVLLAAAHMR
eukprot:4995771-Amphidinium_carterae.6